MHPPASLAYLMTVITAVTAAPTLSKRAMTAQEMVANINAVTTQSQNLQPVVSNIQTGASIIAMRSGQFDPAIDGLQTLTQTLQTDTSEATGTKPYSAADAQAVCDAFSRFSTVHQSTLSILADKAAVLEGVTQMEVGQTLKTQKAALNDMAFAVLSVVPSCQAEATQDRMALDKMTSEAACQYTPGGSLGVDLLC